MVSVLHRKALGLEDLSDLPVVTGQVQGLDSARAQTRGGGGLTLKRMFFMPPGGIAGRSSCVAVTLSFESGGAPISFVSKSVIRPNPNPDALAPDPRFSSITFNSLPLGLKGTWDQILALLLIGCETPRRS